MNKQEIIPGLRIIGNASDKNKAKAKKEIELFLTDSRGALPLEDRKFISRYEYPKTDQEKFLIEFVNFQINHMRKSLGLAAHTIPHNNYYILPSEVYNSKTGKGSNGFAAPKRQVVLLRASTLRESPLALAGTIFHETLHLNGHLCLRLEERTGKIVKKVPVRMGVEVQSMIMGEHGFEYHSHFSGLHEAIVSHYQKEFIPKLQNISFLQKEFKNLKSLTFEKTKKKIAQQEYVQMDDIVWANKETTRFLAVNYSEQRKVFNFICDKIAEKLPQQFENSDMVYREFLRAHFTGRMLPLARVIESIFDEGSFRRLGDMDTDRMSGALTLEAFKRMKTKI